MPGSLEGATDQIPEENNSDREMIIDAESRLNEEETTRLNELNIQNTEKGLNPDEIIERNNLEAKNKGENLGPLSPSEKELLRKLQIRQTKSENWTTEDVSLINLLQDREKMSNAGGERMVA